MTLQKKPVIKKQKKQRVEDTQIVVDRKVRCDGTHALIKNISTGHPAVFLQIIANETQISCPYCSRLFLYEGE